MYDIAVIGAGVVGGLIARRLSAYDLKICILEKANDVAMGATKANSAIVHAGFDAKEGSLKAKLNVRGSEMMEEVAKELGVKYKRNGSLVIAFTEEDRKTVGELYERGVRNGVRDLEIVEGDRLHTLEPNLSKKVIAALWAPTGAIICPYELAIAAVGNAMDNGAELFRNFEVRKITRDGEKYTISSTDNCVEAKYVINCAGLHSDDVARMVGDCSFDVHARRGEYILMDKECGGLITHTVFRTPSKMGKGILVSPTVDNNLLIGPTSVDMEEKDNNETTPEGIAKVISESAENVDGIPYGKVITSFCGLRAVGSTGDFIIRFSADNFLTCAGIESPGLSASPAIAEYVENMLLESGMKYNKKTDYVPTRAPYHAFAEMSIEEKNEIIAKDPRYGKIVCRCEKVSEGEIVDAIRRNPGALDVDGVKRRTRSGMGRCQGGFCMPLVVKIISRETGIPFDKITKCGGGSYINVGKTKGGA